MDLPRKPTVTSLCCLGIFLGLVSPRALVSGETSAESPTVLASAIALQYPDLARQFPGMVGLQVDATTRMPTLIRGRLGQLPPGPVDWGALEFARRASVAFGLDGQSGFELLSVVPHTVGGYSVFLQQLRDGGPVAGAGLLLEVDGDREARLIQLDLVPSSTVFLRGDVNGDGSVDYLSDAICLLQWLYLSGREPQCLKAADVNDDGSVASGVADAIYLLSAGFLGGSPVPAPFPACGADPTPDELPCDRPGAICDGGDVVQPLAFQSAESQGATLLASNAETMVQRAAQMLREADIAPQKAVLVGSPYAEQLKEALGQLDALCGELQDRPMTREGEAVRAAMEDHFGLLTGGLLSLEEFAVAWSDPAGLIPGLGDLEGQSDLGGLDLLGGGLQNPAKSLDDLRGAAGKTGLYSFGVTGSIVTDAYATVLLHGTIQEWADRLDSGEGVDSIHMHSGSDNENGYSGTSLDFSVSGPLPGDLTATVTVHTTVEENNHGAGANAGEQVEIVVEDEDGETVTTIQVTVTVTCEGESCTAVAMSDTCVGESCTHDESTFEFGESTGGGEDEDDAGSTGGSGEDATPLPDEIGGGVPPADSPFTGMGNVASEELADARLDVRGSLTDPPDEDDDSSDPSEFRPIDPDVNPLDPYILTEGGRGEEAIPLPGGGDTIFDPTIDTLGPDPLDPILDGGVWIDPNKTGGLRPRL